MKKGFCVIALFVMIAGCSQEQHRAIKKGEDLPPAEMAKQNVMVDNKGDAIAY